MDDQTLLKRASHAGRNLTVLAVLASLAMLLVIGLAVSIKDARSAMVPLAIAITLIASAYWILMVAARRGNPASVGVVIVLMIVQLVLGLLVSSIIAAQNKASFQFQPGGFIIPIIVIIALVSSRTVLLELQERGLWEQAFPTSKPSGNLVVIGGVILVLGFLSLNASTFYAGIKIKQAGQSEHQQAEAFVQLVQQDEAKFMVSMQKISGKFGDAELNEALANLAILEQKLGQLQQTTGNANGPLSQILNTYGNAIRQWKNGLTILKQPNPDKDRALQMLKLGDKFRADAGDAFDHRYVAPKNP